MIVKIILTTIHTIHVDHDDDDDGHVVTKIIIEIKRHKSSHSDLIVANSIDIETTTTTTTTMTTTTMDQP